MSWQNEMMTRLSDFFAADEAVRAVVVCGSLADEKTAVDLWSDVDLKIVLADDALTHYVDTLGWLAPFGEVVGVEHHIEPTIQTLRLCLAGLRRLDLVFVAESVVEQKTAVSLFPAPAKLLWSKLPDLINYVGVAAVDAAYRPFSLLDLAKMADAFWYRLGTAVVKTKRDDLLIGLHLALDCLRDCLVLQMIRRDRAQGVTIHRFGGWGNEFVTQIPQTTSAADILNLLAWCGETFDQLASELSPLYQERRDLMDNL